MADPKPLTKEDVKVTVKALKPLRAENGSQIPVGGTTEVVESTAAVLVKNKQAELVTQTKV